MHLMGKRHGVQKVGFWVIILIALLSLSAGVRLGVLFSQGIALPKELIASISSMTMRFWEHFVNLFNQDVKSSITQVIIAIIVAVVLVYLCYKHLPKKRKTFDFNFDLTLTLEEFQVALYIGMVVLGIFAGKEGGIGAKVLSIDFGILTVAVIFQIIMVLQDVYVKPNSKDYAYFEQNKKSVLLKTTLIGIALVGFPLWIPDFWGFTLPQILEDKDLLGYYTAILSLTFISISVMSVLSDRTVIIYWENIAEGKLIKPVFGSFAAYTYYSIGAALGAGVCVVLKNATAFVIFCVINITTMILLTYTMVDVYYDRASKKVKREKELQMDAEDYRWVREEELLSEEAKELHHINKETNEKYTDREIEDKWVGYERYVEKMLLLCQNIHRANDEHDLIYLREVHELYQKNLNCFNTPEGKRVVYMLFSECTAQSWPLMIGCLKAHINEMVKSQSYDKDPFVGRFWDAGNMWNQDEQLWAAMVESDYFKKWLRSVSRDLMDTRELQEFTLLLIRRMVVLYNDMVAHYNQQEKNEKCEYLKVIDGNTISIKTKQGERPKKEQVAIVFNESFDAVLVETTFAARIMRVLYVMLENLDDNVKTSLPDIFNDFSVPNHFTPFLRMLGFSDEEIRFWEKFFPSKN